MNRRNLGRRGALSGGLAAVLLTPLGDADDWAPHASLTHQDHEVAQDGAHHPPFLVAFLDWLHTESGRLVLPVAVDMATPSRADLRVQGVHPAIRIALHRHCEINVGVMWEEKYRNALLWLDAHEERGPDGVGWINSGLYSGLETIHPTREALWHADVFEPLLTWINEDRTQATHLAIWETDGSAAWARLLREGKVLSRGWTVEEREASSSHLVSIHRNLA